MSTDEEVYTSFTPVQLEGLRSGTLRKKLKLGEPDIRWSAEAEAFMMGVLTLIEVLAAYNITVTIPHEELARAATTEYPLAQLSDPEKINEFGGSPPLAIPRK